jgi:putative nicotinate phosphoribosyltransferase
MTNPALMIDKYELTMLDALVREDRHRTPATFEVFARRLPPGFRYGVFAGLGRLLPMIKEADFLSPTATGDGYYSMWESMGLDYATVEYLNCFQRDLSITIEAYAEGDLYFPYSPVLSVSGELGQCLLLETLILSVLNHDSAIATKAARMVSVASGRNLIEMGSRRTNEHAAIAAARAAYLVGFDATSNVAAGMEHNIPTTGTAAHAFTLAHDNEADAFAAQIEAQGCKTTFLVDTYDVAKGILTAIEACHAAGGQPGAVRIDSGDLAANAYMARKMLDEHGCYTTKIIVTGDLDEYVIKDLRDAPIDGYGVGTQLVSVPPAGMVYKLVEIDGKPVAKKSKDKVSIGGKKMSWRESKDGQISAEKFTTDEVVEPEGYLQHRVMDNGRIVEPMVMTNQEIRDLHTSVFHTLPVAEQTVWMGNFDAYITCEKEENQ